MCLSTPQTRLKISGFVNLQGKIKRFLLNVFAAFVIRKLLLLFIKFISDDELKSDHPIDQI